MVTVGMSALLAFGLVVEAVEDGEQLLAALGAFAAVGRVNAVGLVQAGVEGQAPDLFAEQVGDDAHGFGGQFDVHRFGSLAAFGAAPNARYIRPMGR